MPTLDIQDLPPVLAYFAAHWEAVDAELAPQALLLPGNYALSDFRADQEAYQDALTEISSTDSARRVAMAERDNRKRLLLPRFAQFRAAVTGYLAHTGFAGSLPRAPQVRRAGSRFLTPMRQAAFLWNLIDTEPIPGFAPPLLLTGSYALADFEAEIAALEALFDAAREAELNAKQARLRRDAQIAALRARMKQYRLAVQSRFPAEHALPRSLPRLTPPTRRKKAPETPAETLPEA